MGTAEQICGISVWRAYLDRAAQEHLVADLRAIAQSAPMFHPETRWGKKMSVQMTSAGSLGWFSDRRGYRYAPTHPAGQIWPNIPETILAVWHDLTQVQRSPECCLVNYYGEGARMGLHQDRDEADFSWPVLSISLGDDALFRIGGQERSDPTQSFWLHSGDVMMLSGPNRLAFHGIDRIKYQSSDLLPNGGRLNVTLRVVT